MKQEKNQTIPKLEYIEIENFRSIRSQKITFKKIDDSYTYILIGINESGKSSLLQAMSLKNSTDRVFYQKDFYDSVKPVIIKYIYNNDGNKFQPTISSRLKELNVPDELISKTIVNKFILIIEYGCTEPNTSQRKIEINLEENTFTDFTFNGTSILKKSESSMQDDLDMKKYMESALIDFFFNFSHEVVFWKSEAKYLISDPINLDSFSQNPEGISIPLMNCFRLSGIENIPNQITLIKNNPAETKNLTDKLQDTVTNHIKRIWPGHPVNIKFNIDGISLSFLVEDDGVRYKSKTVAQRSDGFRQFISFLLTISAQKSTNKLSNTLLLLDEPETHLHPQGQENLRDELINISKGDQNNIVLFATHSNYMIDKNHLDRCYRVLKEKNEITELLLLENKKASYSEVNYEVFEVPTNDYHNELYGFLEENKKEKLDGLTKNKKWYNKKTEGTEDVSLATYIRHSIHHPENTENDKYTLADLRASIDQMRKLKYEP